MLFFLISLFVTFFLLPSESLICRNFRQCIRKTFVRPQHCDGFYSCQLSTFRSTAFCSGYHACSHSKIYGVAQCAGNHACIHSKIYGLAKCTGRAGCHSARIISRYNAYCSGLVSCYRATIKVRSATTICNSKQACLGANIEAARVNVDGLLGAQNARIKANLVIADCKYSLQKSIITPLSVGRTLTVKLDGFRAGNGAIVRCVSKNTCNIICGKNNGCQGLRVFCYSGTKCNIRCNPAGGITCPLVRGPRNVINCPKCRGFGRQYHYYRPHRDEIEIDDNEINLDDNDDDDDDEYDDDGNAIAVEANDQELNELFTEIMKEMDNEDENDIDMDINNDDNDLNNDLMVNSIETDMEIGGFSNILKSNIYLFAIIGSVIIALMVAYYYYYITKKSKNNLYSFE